MTLRITQAERAVIRDGSAAEVERVHGDVARRYGTRRLHVQQAVVREVDRALPL